MGTCSPRCPGGLGRRLTPAQIGTLLIQANPGLSGDKLRSAATRGIATALAESGGYPGACNHYTGPAGVENVYGLWQISTVHGTGLAPCDPATAAKLFWQLSAGGTNWTPWTSSAYLPHMPAAAVGYRRAAVGAAGAAVGVANTIAGGIGNAVPFDPFSAIRSIADAVIFLVKFLTSPNTWLRVAEVLGGGILVLFGLWILFSQTKAGQSANAAAGSAAKGAVIAA